MASHGAEVELRASLAALSHKPKMVVPPCAALWWFTYQHREEPDAIKTVIGEVRALSGPTGEDIDRVQEAVGTEWELIKLRRFGRTPHGERMRKRARKQARAQA